MNPDMRLRDVFERRYRPARLGGGSIDRIREHREAIHAYSDTLGRPARLSDLAGPAFMDFRRAHGDVVAERLLVLDSAVMPMATPLPTGSKRQGVLDYFESVYFPLRTQAGFFTPGTAKQYRSACKAFTRYSGGCACDRVTPRRLADFRDWQEAQGVSSKKAADRAAFVRAVVNHATTGSAA